MNFGLEWVYSPIIGMDLYLLYHRPPFTIQADIPGGVGWWRVLRYVIKVEARGPFGVKSGGLGFWGVRNFLVDIFGKRGGRTFLGVIKSVRTPGSQFYIKELHLIRKQKNLLCE